MTISVVFPFDDPSNYALDGLEVSGGAARIIDQAPANLGFSAEYETDGDFDARIAVDPTGTPNGGAVVLGGLLDLRTGGSMSRVDYPPANSNALIGDKGAIRIRIIPDYSGAPAGDRYLFGCGVAAGNVDRLDCYHRAGGGADDRILFLMYDDAGVSVIGGVTFLLNTTAGTEIEIEFNWDLTLGIFRAFRNGVLGFENLAIPISSRGGTNDRFRVGNSRNGNDFFDGWISGFSMFSEMQHTADYTPNVINGGELVPLAYGSGTLITNAAFQSEDATGLVSVDTPNAGTVLFALEVDGQLRYWDGAAWADSDGTAGQLSTAADIDANAATLITAGASLVRVFSRLTAENGAADATPELDSMVYSYDFGPNVPADSVLCEVFGFVRDMAGNAIAGAIVTADPVRPRQYVESGEVVIVGPRSAVTDADGRFDLKLIQGLEARITVTSGTEPEIDVLELGAPILITVPPLDFVNVADLLPPA